MRLKKSFYLYVIFLLVLKRVTHVTEKKPSSLYLISKYTKNAP